MEQTNHEMEQRIQRVMQKPDNAVLHVPQPPTRLERKLERALIQYSRYFGHTYESPFRYE